jgi:intracellular septation protein A
MLSSTPPTIIAAASPAAYGDAMAEAEARLASGVAVPEPPAPLALIRSVGPRLLRDILGPPLAFYPVWKGTGNVLIGVAVATAVSLAIYFYERGKGRPGLIARVVLLFILAAAIIGIATNSATAYLIQPAVLGVINGVLWLGSVALGKPLAGTFAQEIFPVSDEVRSSPEYFEVFRRVSLMFGVFFVVAAAIQLVVLLIFGVGAFLATRVADALSIIGMIGYSVRYISHQLGQHLMVSPAPPAAAEALPVTE